jgi:hypothetical protein
MPPSKNTDQVIEHRREARHLQRERPGGVGKFCREREAAVNERRQAVDVAMRAVEQTADSQTERPSESLHG